MLVNFTRTRRRTSPATRPVANYAVGKTYLPLVPGVNDGRFSQTGFPVLHFYDQSWEYAEICMDSVHPGPPYRSGGPFQHRLYACKYPPHGVFGSGTYIQADKAKKYVGGFSPPPRWRFNPTGAADAFDFEGRPISTNLLLEVNSDKPSMTGWGDKAWSSTKPKLEKAGLSVFLAEARDIPRMLKTTARLFHNSWKELAGPRRTSWSMQPKRAAEQFINHQFGWAPFLKDMRSLDYVYQNSAKVIARLSEKNGQMTRRRVTLKTESTDVKLASGTGNFLTPGLDGPPWTTGERSKWTLSERKTVTITAVGAFKYYRPEFDLGSPDYSSAWNRVMRQMTIYGLRVTPSNLYKATPWTWAIDWMSKVGDHVDHLNDILVDSVANKYCFAMQHQTISRVYNQYIPTMSGSVSLEFERIIDSKERVEGTSPYGFGLAESALTARQFAIAVALGILRPKRP